MARRLIGTGTTNAQGIATCNTTYTGVGAGKLQIIAVSGDLQSETYEVYDCIFRDGGITGDSNYTAFYNYAAFNPQVSSTGTLLTNSTTSTANYFANIDSTSDLYDFTAPFCVEFDIVSFEATYTGIQITETGETGVIKNFSQLGITGACHLKVVVNGTQILYYVDDEAPVTQDYTVTKARVSLTLNNGTLTYKNFMIYPI